MLPAILFVGGTVHTDFVHYSSEQTPLLLLMPGVVGGMRPLASWRRTLRFMPYLAAFCAGAIPFAKLQAAPLALVAGGGLLVRALDLPETTARRRATVLLLACATAPSVLFLGPLAVRGELHHFTTSYIRWATVYVTTPLSPTAVIRMAQADPVFYGLALCMTTAAAAWLMMLAFADRAWDRETITQCVLCLGLLAAAILAVMTPGWDFPHYLYLLVPTGALTSGVLLAMGQRGAARRMRRRVVPEVILFAATGYRLALSSWTTHEARPLSARRDRRRSGRPVRSDLRAGT